MKKILKISAAVLSVVLIFSMFCLPVSAKIAGGSIQWNLRLEKVTTPGVIDDDSGMDATELGNIYKVVVSLNSNVPLNSMQVGVAYDADLFDVCYGDDTGNYLTYPCGDDTGYTIAHKILGTLADNDAYDANGVGGQTSGVKIKAYGPSHASAKTNFVMQAIPSTDERWTNGIKWGYTDLGATPPANTGLFITKYALNNTLSKGVVLPEGQQDLVEVYLMLKEGKTDADVNNTEMRMTILDYSAASNPTQYGSLNCWMRDTEPDTVETCTTNGTSYIYTQDAPAGPVVDKSKAEVKMTPNSATTVEDAFTFRVTSVISDADWDTYFANTGAEGATTNAITALGFVAYKGTEGFDMDTAKAVAGGAAAEGYEAATTDYVQKADDASDAYFGARIEITSAATRSDATYIAFVEYLDADGQPATASYEASYQALLNTNYTDIVSAYLAAYPYAA